MEPSQFLCSHSQFCKRWNTYLMFPFVGYHDKNLAWTVRTGTELYIGLMLLYLEYEALISVYKKMKGILESMLKMKCIVWLFMGGCRRRHAAGPRGARPGLAVPCSTLLSGCFQCSSFQSPCQHPVVTGKSLL